MIKSALRANKQTKKSIKRNASKHYKYMYSYACSQIDNAIRGGAFKCVMYVTADTRENFLNELFILADKFNNQGYQTKFTHNTDGGIDGLNLSWAISAFLGRYYSVS